MTTISLNNGLFVKIEIYIVLFFLLSHILGPNQQFLNTFQTSKSENNIKKPNNSYSNGNCICVNYKLIEIKSFIHECLVDQV